MKTTVLFIVGFLMAAVSSYGENFLSFLECHTGESTLEYYLDGAIDVGGSNVTVIGLYQSGARFSRDPDTGALTFVEDIAVGSSGINIAQVIPGRFLYVARGYNDEIVVMDRAADGSVTEIQTVTDGIDGVDGIENTADVCVSADGKNVYAVGKDDDAVAVFTRNTSDGTLTFLEAHFDTDTGIDGLDGAQAIAIAPNDDFVYVGSGQDDAIAIFARDATTGALTYSGMISNADDGVSGLNYPKIIVIPPLSGYLYTSGDGVTVFERDAATGALTFVETHSLSFAYAMASQPKADRLYVAADGSDSLTVFETNETDGTLSQVEQWVQGTDGMTCLDSPSAAFISPGGGSLYVGGQNGTLAVFSIGVFGDDFETGDSTRWTSTTP